MNDTQSDLFGGINEIPENPLTGRRVGFIGKFKNRAALVRRVKEFGAAESSKDGLTRDTQILVVGDEVKKEVWDRLTCYEHDGWHALRITHEELQSIFSGHYEGFETPKEVKKHIVIDMGYYNWTPPTMTDDDDEESATRCTSPLKYGDTNPISGKEIYVPGESELKIHALRQIIGNLGGYANAEYFDDTNVVLLPNATLEKLRNGERDEIIRHIEDKHNNGGSPTFNVQFTCEHDLIEWVKQRLEKYPDESTQKLLDSYLA